MNYSRRYRLGEVINGRQVVGYGPKGRYRIKCLSCGKVTNAEISFARTNCRCIGGGKRYSGLVYENPPERLEAIKEKYKNGVTLEMIEDMVLNAK